MLISHLGKELSERPCPGFDDRSVGRCPDPEEAIVRYGKVE
jgi:hypothetical protein